MSGKPMRLRFAPSPTGSLHLGNARTALFNWLVARSTGGNLVLRIEDTDTERHQVGAEEGILRDLRWLGLDWDEGPYRQSERGEHYLRALEELMESGQAYRCFCTAEERSEQQGYSGRCRNLARDESDRRAASGEPYAIRFKVQGVGAVVLQDRFRGAVEFPISEIGDPVLARRDGRPTYNFAVVVDDAAMQIDLVLRGDDHLSNTPRQVLLYQALELPVPEFAHLPMVRGADGQRLSKRHGAVSVAEYRRKGYPVAGLLNALALLGWSPGADRTLVGIDEMVELFDLSDISRSASVFDQTKLDWLSNQYMQRTDTTDLAPGIRDRLLAAGLVEQSTEEKSEGWFLSLADLLRPRLACLDDAPGEARQLFFPGAVQDGAGDAERLVLTALAEKVSANPPATPDSWREMLQQVKKETGVKGKKLFHPIRLAVTGEEKGPELDRLVPLIVVGERLFPNKVTPLYNRLVRAAGG